MTEQTDGVSSPATAEKQARPTGILPDSLQARRDKIATRPTLDLAYRIGIGVLGLAVLILGIVLIPYPGPGWLVVFAGLGILATEFAWAHRTLVFARGKYDQWLEWMKRQHWSVQAAFGIATFAIVLATLWLLGALHLVGGWFGYDPSWLKSPIFG
ncbi:TIGR02611 family protein [Williamsia sp. CHRR-6]|uniref:TIGR02611 family protein n=1 Tax=Williamsia sp. CHRR-6 TaxID=2835871 RepID=UPI001BDA91B0|nr:TIGR02611 family protein [Williamsia sp. CHRR-6]MBT0567965.1 TIGR02611 family protein [Williamsia sp. CHRR-6]